MDTLDIDDILSAVTNMNNNDSVQNILDDLHHRSPVVKSVDNNLNRCPPNDHSFQSRQTINRPVDPAGSASSSDDSNLNANKQSHVDVSPSSVAIPVPTTDVKKKRKVHLNVPDNIPEEQSNDENHKQNSRVVVPTKNIQKSHMTSLMGYNIPTTTLYFIIVMCVIAIALYFLTAEKKKDKDKQKKKESE
jgi:hypothetical protein